MPYPRPPLQQLEDDTVQRLELDLAATGKVGVLHDKTTLYAFGKSVGGSQHELHGHVDHIGRQLMPSQAEEEGLDEWLYIAGLTPRGTAEPATGLVRVTGTDGVTIPAGHAFTRRDGGRFTADAAAVISAGLADVAVTAAEPGAAGETAGGATLSLATPITGVDSVATVDAVGLTGGREPENDTEARRRLLVALGHPGQGGNPADMVMWTLEVPGVTRAWVLRAYPEPGFTGITFATDEDPGGPIPTAAMVQAVADYLAPKGPVPGQFHVFAPTELVTDFHIGGLTPNTQTVRDAVTASLADMVAGEGGPAAIGFSTQGQALQIIQTTGTIPLSRINEAISVSPGQVDHTLLDPTAALVTTKVQLRTMGTVTFS